MIFLQPIILAGEFINHTVTLVLIGILLFEYVIHCQGPNNETRRKAVRLLLGMICVGTAMILFEFFVGRGAIWPNVAYVVGIAAILYMAVLFRRLSSETVSVFYSNAFITSVTAILICSIAYIFVQDQSIIFGSTVFQMIAILILYVYVLRFLIRSDAKNP